MSSHFLRTNGINLHYLDHPGAAPTLVLLPGLSANARIFGGLIEAGLSPRFHVLVPDLRGRGFSDAPPAGFDPAAPAANYTMADHAADVIGLLDALEVRRPILVGHSFGGMLALYLAAHAPGRFPRIVVIDWAIALATPETYELVKPVLARHGQVVPSREEYLAAVRQWPVFQDAWDSTIEGYFHADLQENPDGSVQTLERPEPIYAAAEGTLIVDWPAIIAAIRQPVLLLNGQGPFGPPGALPFLPYDPAMATVDALADGRYLEVPGNHLTMIFGEGARRIVEAITAFVEEGPDPRGP